MSDTQVPILTQPPEDTTQKVTDVMTELAEQTKFLSQTLNKNIKTTIKTEKKNDELKKKEDQTIKSSPDKKDPIGQAAIKSGVDAGINTMKLAQETFLGDISFATEPLKKMGGILGDIGGFFGLKKKKVAPKRSAMLKTNPEAVYTVDSLTKLLESDDSMMDKFKGLLPYLMGAGGIGALAKKFGPMVMKAGAVGLLAGGLLWMAIDGIKGYFKAEEWGTSKLAAVIGGALGGTGEGGWKDAFKGMGKDAMIGAGAGFLIAGPVGALIGGIIGAATGGILGYLGGQKIAKWADEAGKDTKEALSSWGGAMETMGSNMKNSWSSFKDAWGDGKERFKEWADNFSESVGKFFTLVKDGFNSFIQSSLDVATLVSGWINDKIITPISSFFTSIYDSINTATGGALDKIVGWVEDFIISPIKDFFSMIGGAIGDFFVNLFGDKRTDEEKAIDQAKSDKLRDHALANNNTGYRPPSTNTNPWESIGNYKWRHSESGVEKQSYNQPDATDVDDAIIRPDGSIVRTHPDDTIIATKNPIAFADKESSSAMNDINKSSPSIMANLESLIKELIKKQQTQAPSNMMQQNITSRYNPQAIMANLTTEVF